jgi:hypothetical protein
MTDPYSALGLGCLSRQRANEACYRASLGLCPACERRTEQIVAELPQSVQVLTLSLARTRAPCDGPAPPNKPASVPPINLAIEALRSEIVYTAALWEEIIRESQNLSPRRRGSMRDAVSIRTSVAILSPRTVTLAQLPAVEAYHRGVEAEPCQRTGLEGLRRLVDLWDLTHQAAGLARVEIALPGHCPACDAPALRRHQGADTVWCECCHGRWPYNEYAAHVACQVGAA